jgi:hypothetical protein
MATFLNVKERDGKITRKQQTKWMLQKENHGIRPPANRSKGWMVSRFTTRPSYHDNSSFTIIAYPVQNETAIDIQWSLFLVKAHFNFLFNIRFSCFCHHNMCFNCSPCSMNHSSIQCWHWLRAISARFYELLSWFVFGPQVDHEWDDERCQVTISLFHNPSVECEYSL